MLDYMGVSGLVHKGPWLAMGGPFLPPLHKTRMSSGFVGLPFLEVNFFLVYACSHCMEP